MHTTATEETTEEKPVETPPETKTEETKTEETKIEETETEESPTTLIGDAPTEEEKTDDTKAEEKKEEEKPAEKKVPEKYELTLPENSILDKSILERTAATARELGLSQEEGQKVLEFVSKEAADRYEALLAENRPGGTAWNQLVKTWNAEVLADKEIGGSQEAVTNNAAIAKRVVARYFPKSVQDFLHESGYGSNPDVFRALVRIGKAMSEDQLILPKVPSKQPRDRADLFYGESDDSSQEK